jgi:peptide/nickel transport system permease protein
MSSYIIRRLLLAVPTVLGATVVIFLIMRIVPGDVVDYLLGDSASITVEQKEALRNDLGLNDPLPIQSLDWLKGVVTFSPGDSVRTRKPIMDEVRPRILVTTELAGERSVG